MCRHRAWPQMRPQPQRCCLQRQTAPLSAAHSLSFSALPLILTLPPIAPLPREPLLQVTWETHIMLGKARNPFRHVWIALSLSVMTSPQLHRLFYGAASSATRMHDTHSAKNSLLVGLRPQCLSTIACATCVEERMDDRRGRDSRPVIHGTTDEPHAALRV